MGRPLLLFGLIWGSFLAVLPFAAFGDTSVLHISSHLIQLPLLAAATVLAWHCRRAAVGRARRALTWVLSVTVPVAFVSIAVELGIAIDRLRDDGWVNLDTADIWEEGPHFVVASFTVPAMTLSMLMVLALVVTTLLGGRRQVEPIVEGTSSDNPEVPTREPL